ncbi:MAG TPA: hypothetical protein GXX35_08080 [Thermoanaerobacterales bacterium]|nr:hypothetical protein [Thermoanaerobacterales bacterium]
MTHDNIPWMKKEEQPEYSNDIFPMCFFQLQSLDDDIKPQGIQKDEKNLYQIKDATNNFNETLYENGFAD